MTVRTIELREPVMARNNEIAETVRARLAAAGVPALNFVSSPGSGKTLLLERTPRTAPGQPVSTDRETIRARSGVACGEVLYERDRKSDGPRMKQIQATARIHAVRRPLRIRRQACRIHRRLHRQEAACKSISAP